MKRKLHAFLLIGYFALLMPILTQAQLRAGLKGGASMTDLKTTSSLLNDVDPIANGHVGIFIQYSPLGQAFKKLDTTKPVARKKTFWSDFAWGLAVQPECLFTTGGGRLNNVTNSHFTSVGLTESNYVLRTYDLELPLNIQAGIRYKQTLFFAQFAPFLSVRLAGSMNDKAEDYTTLNDKFAFNTLLSGYGYGIGIQRNNWQLEVNHRLTTTRMGKETPYPVTNVNYNPFYNMNQQRLMVSLGYLF